MKLNLGCGTDLREGWVNADTYPYAGISVRCSLRDLPFRDSSFDEVEMIHVIEHMPAGSIKDVPRVLKRGGTLRVVCPDANFAIHAWNSAQWGSDWFEHVIFGERTREGQWHQSCWTVPTLERELRGLGLQDVVLDLIDGWQLRGVGRKG